MYGYCGANAPMERAAIGKRVQRVSVIIRVIRPTGVGGWVEFLFERTKAGYYPIVRSLMTDYMTGAESIMLEEMPTISGYGTFALFSVYLSSQPRTWIVQTRYEKEASAMTQMQVGTSSPCSRYFADRYSFAHPTPASPAPSLRSRRAVTCTVTIQPRNGSRYGWTRRS